MLRRSLAHGFHRHPRRQFGRRREIGDVAPSTSHGSAFQVHTPMKGRGRALDATSFFSVGY